MKISESSKVENKVNIKNFSKSQLGDRDEERYKAKAVVIEGVWPQQLSGHIYIVGPYHRQGDYHLFAGEGVVIRWDLKAQDQQLTVYSKKLDTWDSLWHSILPMFNLNLLRVNFPAVISVFGVSEIGNTAITKLEKMKGKELTETRIILTADAGRYWEIDPVSLDTLTPIGYFDQHVVALPFLFFPLVENTAHPFYDKDKQELITCELKLDFSPGKILRGFIDLENLVYILRWDGKTQIEKWQLQGTQLEGSPHTAIVTEKYVLIPDMPFQLGVGKLLGLKFPPEPAYPKTQIYIVDREQLNKQNKTVASQLITFGGDSYHFLCNYYHVDEKICLVAIQQATISLTEAITRDDINHFTGEKYSEVCLGIPWMFGFDPGVLRKVVIKNAQIVSEETFWHRGWFSTTLYTADPRELDSQYTAIYQVYGGYHRDLICRRQYIDFRDNQNRVLQDEELPQDDLPSVLAKVPLNQNWNDLTQAIEKEYQECPDTSTAFLGKALLDFYVCEPGYVINSIQFVPQADKSKGYIFTTVLTPTETQEVWLFDAQSLRQGPVAKLKLPETVHFGFTLHSEFLNKIIEPPRPSVSEVNRLLSAIRSLLFVPWQLFPKPWF